MFKKNLISIIYIIIYKKNLQSVMKDVNYVQKLMNASNAKILHLLFKL